MLLKTLKALYKSSKIFMNKAEKQLVKEYKLLDKPFIKI
jgi:hypothetical protein